ncbi:hypothetical protein CAPTEDRAFT_176282 [Capitella teleta]|uniref:Angio-associated migratory cell protein n=1 Tax=Capitella teleta TaxID=283909 RepID=R7U128_CAPTE|nr:hypothetical protein CAPTEDRAFT_176282 [Capitella teleta]|eukprot:ELT96890.1 hypothetical protein CAPTEDRAFT_176282 [Capitella teleta]
MAPFPEMHNPDQNEDGNEDAFANEEDEFLTEDDLQEIPDEEQNPEDEMIADMDNMDLEEEPVKDDAAVVFSKHTDSVFAVCVDPAFSSYALTGGEDDVAYVWKISSGEVFMECTGHKDSVTCVGFSHDSTMAATGDMGGLIKVWSMASKEEIWSFEVSDLEWIEWHHAAHVLLAGTTMGDMWMWKIPSGECKTFQGSGHSCTVGRIMPDGKRVVCGYEDGSVKFWDLKAATALRTVAAHKGSITSLVCHHENVIVMTGSTDVTSKLINSQSGKILTTFECGASDAAPKTQEDMEDEEEAGQEDSVEALGFSKDGQYMATGTLIGMLTIWDMQVLKPRFQCKHNAGIVRLCWHPSSPSVFTCTLDGVVRRWDARSGKCEGEWTGHMSDILDLALVKDGSCIISASGDRTARVFMLNSAAS